jgi:hypothetical protein
MLRSHLSPLRVCAVLLLTLNCALAIASPTSEQELGQIHRCQAEATAATWSWNDEEATPEYCARREQHEGRYRMELIYAGAELSVRVCQKDGTLLYAFPAHRHTVFDIDGDMLYYADYHFSSNGCAVVAYDLQAKRELWRTHLRGMGAIGHSAYYNRVTLQAYDGVIVVKGWEAEKYLEYLNAKNGRTIAHRVFNEPREGMSLSLAVDHTACEAGGALRLTATLSNEGKDREIRYALDRLDAVTLYLIEPNGNELFLTKSGKAAGELTSTVLRTGERMPVLDCAFALRPQSQDAWGHRFDSDIHFPIILADGRKIEYSNPRVEDLAAPMFPAPGVYHLYLTFAGADTFPYLRSDYITFSITEPKPVPAGVSPSFKLSAGYRHHAFQFIQPSPSGRFIACHLPKGCGGDDRLHIYDNEKGRWNHLPPVQCDRWNWLPDESGLLLGHGARDSETAPTRYWYDLSRIGLDGRMRRLLRYDGGVFEWLLLPDASGIVIAGHYGELPAQTEDDPGERRTQVQYFDLTTARLRPVWVSPVSTGLYGFKNDWLSVRKHDGDWVLAHHGLGDDPVSYWINLRTDVTSEGEDASYEDNYAYTPDGRMVVAHGKLRHALHWPTATRQVAGDVITVFALATPEITYRWSPDSRKLLISRWDAEQHLDTFSSPIYEIHSGRLLYTLDDTHVPAKSWPVAWVGTQLVLMERRTSTGNASEFFLVTLGVPKHTVSHNEALFRIEWRQ